ncbi:MAG: glycosyltransferase family 1 protein [Cytophagales bacterium]|nr:MAG: glycosyltransferase family 1 protein [Cytophagales bacterium]
MTDGGIRLLLIYSSGVAHKYSWLDTLRIAFKTNTLSKLFPEKIREYKLIKLLLGNSYEALSYVIDWLEAFQSLKGVKKINLCNINNLIEYKYFAKKMAEYDWVVILHSATGDNIHLLNQTAHYYHSAKKLTMFIGNEYDLMEEKIDFISQAGVKYICSQLTEETAKWLYEDIHQKVKLVMMPHALNPNIYFPSKETTHREIDIGFKGDLYPLWVGDTVRNDFLLKISENEFNLNIDITLNQRVGRVKWAEFLNKTNAIVGAESGSLYLDKKGIMLKEAKKFLAENPMTSIKDLKATIFDQLNVEFKSGRAISSRHFEPIGTKTCQILLEGHYNGILQAGQHYIAVHPDLSNLKEAIALYKDVTYRDQIVEQAYEYVLESHTYHKRIEYLKEIVERDK